MLNCVATDALSCWKARRTRLAHIELNLRERRRIEEMLNAKASVRKIAEAIGRP
ncbi:MAG: hypothetical protein CMI67_24995 [Pelagibaca sp.]|nr:hypothetical protein [Pelagibaca sp.]